MCLKTTLASYNINPVNGLERRSGLGNHIAMNPIGEVFGVYAQWVEF